MRKLILTFAILLTAVMANAKIMWSNQILTDNLGMTGNSSTMVAMNWKYSAGQCIYTKSELNLPTTTLSGIAFCLAQDLGTPDTAQIEIWMALSLDSVFSSRTDFADEQYLIKVYDGPMVHALHAGDWTYITFDTPFGYDSATDLLIYMVYKSGDFAKSYPYYKNNGSHANSHIIAYSDDQPVRANNVSECSGAINEKRPCIKLRYDGVENYGIKIGNTQVTSANAYNITDSLITSGSAYFDAETNTLTLDNVNAPHANIYASDFSRGDLTVRVIGTCNIEEFWYSGYVNTTLVGDATATLNASYIGIFNAAANDVTLTLSGLNVNLTDPSTNYALYGYGRENLLFDNCHFEANASVCPVDEFKSITLRNCGIVYPVGAVVEDGCIRVNGSHNIDSVCIERIESYGITIGNTEVTSLNADNITDDMITSGTASFDAETNTLTLDNLNAYSAYILTEDFNRGDLTIRIIGTNRFYTLTYSSYVNTTIVGDATATINASAIGINDAAVNDITLTLSGLNVNLTEQNVYFRLFGYGNENLLFDNCHFEARTDVCPVDEFKSISFNDCEIVYPVGAVVEDGCIRVNGSHDIDSVCIERIANGLRLMNATEFSVIPNPAVDVVTLSGVELVADGYMTMTDASGRTVAAIKIPASESDYTMDVATLPAGIYYITITTGTTRYRSTLIKK